MKKSKEDAEKTRQAILESALDIFTNKGYAKATFDEIAINAGFTKGAIYWYFKNKADLLTALITEYIFHKQTEIVEQLPEGNDLDDLLQYFIVWAEASQNDMRFAKFNRFILCQMEWSETILNYTDKNLTTIKNAHLEKINQILLECRRNDKIKKEIDINKTSEIILATYMGIMFASLSKRFDYNMVDMVKTGLGLMINGIKK